MLKNTALFCLRQNPDARRDCGVIKRKARIAVALRKIADNAVKTARHIVFLIYLICRLAND